MPLFNFLVPFNLNRMDNYQQSTGTSSRYTCTLPKLVPIDSSKSRQPMTISELPEKRTLPPLSSCDKRSGSSPSSVACSDEVVTCKVVTTLENIFSPRNTKRPARKREIYVKTSDIRQVEKPSTDWSKSDQKLQFFCDFLRPPNEI